MDITGISSFRIRVNLGHETLCGAGIALAGVQGLFLRRVEQADDHAKLRRRTAVGSRPRAQLPVREASAVAIGSENIGPARIQFEGHDRLEVQIERGLVLEILS
jgi:hypothetical protein